MGVLYILYPLDSDVANWLLEQDVAFPADEVGRNPTPAELRAAVSALADISIKETGPYPDGHWQLMLESSVDPERGPWTLINVSEYRHVDQPCSIGFEKGWPSLIVQIAHHLAGSTGPLLVVPDTGDAPIVVWPQRSVSETLRSWKHAG